MSFDIRHPFFILILLFSLTLVVYFPGLSAPFYLDDLSSIVHAGYLHSASFSDVYSVEGIKRVVGRLSFFLNQKLLGGEPAQYRAINILFHCINGMLCFILARKLFSRLCKNLDDHQVLFAALFVAAIFLLHPMQTQAVTYIVQRYASLMTTFYLAALVCYIYARSRKNLFLFILAGLSAGLAILTKESALTIFAILFLIEWIYFEQSSKAKYIFFSFIIGLFLLQLAVFLQLLDLSTLDNMTRDDRSVSRLDYFKSQLIVIPEYIYKFFQLSGYHLEYQEGVRELLAEHNWLAYFISWIALFAFLIKKQKEFALISFCVFAYIFSLSVESSFIPIRDVIVEHRTYLPNFFLSVFVVYIAARSVQYLKRERVQKAVFLLLSLSLLGTLAMQTHARNSLWADQVKFYRNELKYSPGHWRIRNALAVYYMQQGEENKAASLIHSILKHNQGRFYPPVMLNGIGLFRDINPKLSKQLEMLVFKNLSQFSRPDKAKAYVYRGMRLSREGKYTSAKAFIQQGLRMYSEFPEAKLALVNAHISLKEYEQAHKLAVELLSEVNEKDVIQSLITKIRRSLNQS